MSLVNTAYTVDVIIPRNCRPLT